MSTLVYILYNVFSGAIAIICIRNFLKSRNFQEEILYVILAVPFILRVFQIK